jgi:hypothetical protein
MIVFFGAGDWPVSTLFVGLSLVYLTELVTRFNVFEGDRTVGLWQFLTGCWLMYLTYAVTLDLTLGWHWPT